MLDSGTIGIIMLSVGVILGIFVIWRGLEYRRREKASRKPLDD